jgi:hypothetical protein
MLKVLLFLCISIHTTFCHVSSYHTIFFFICWHLVELWWTLFWCYSIFMVAMYLSYLVFTPQNKSNWFSKDSLHSTNSFDFKQAWTYLYSLIILLTMIFFALLLFVCVSLLAITLALFVCGLSLTTVHVKVWVITRVKLLKAWIMPMRMAIYMCLAASSLTLKYSSCFPTSLSWISIHFSSNNTLVALIWSIKSTNILLPFFVVFAMLLSAK